MHVEANTSKICSKDRGRLNEQLARRLRSCGVVLLIQMLHIGIGQLY